MRHRGKVALLSTTLLILFSQRAVIAAPPPPNTVADLLVPDHPGVTVTELCPTVGGFHCLVDGKYMTLQRSGSFHLGCDALGSAYSEVLLHFPSGQYCEGSNGPLEVACLPIDRVSASGVRQMVGHFLDRCESGYIRRVTELLGMRWTT
jgi:hypothetical protein